MTALVVALSLAVGSPQATPARATSVVTFHPRRSARVIAGASFMGLLAAGGLLYRRLGVKAQAEEAEALLDAEFERLERSEADRRGEKPCLDDFRIPPPR